MTNAFRSLRAVSTGGIPGVSQASTETLLTTILSEESQAAVSTRDSNGSRCSSRGSSLFGGQNVRDADRHVKGQQSDCGGGHLS